MCHPNQIKSKTYWEHTSINSRDTTGEERKQQNDDEANGGHVGVGQAANILEDVESVALDNVIWIHQLINRLTVLYPTRHLRRAIPMMGIPRPISRSIITTRRFWGA